MGPLGHLQLGKPLKSPLTLLEGVARLCQLPSSAIHKRLFISLFLLLSDRVCNPSTWKAEAGGSHKLHTSLGHGVNLCLNKTHTGKKEADQRQVTEGKDRAGVEGTWSDGFTLPTPSPCRFVFSFSFFSSTVLKLELRAPSFTAEPLPTLTGALQPEPCQSLLCCFNFGMV